jgi:preprotein translocase SecE subunit
LTVCQADLFILEEKVAEKTKVTRISAKDDTSKSVKAVKAKAVKAGKPARKAPKIRQEGKQNILVRIGQYFKGAWVELKQVRWPTRKATWGLTIAVILFSAFFVGVILLLDALFQWLFDFIIS